VNNNELWKAVLAEIELSISKANFITWFKNTFIVSRKEGHIILGVPNGFAKEWLENKYRPYILKALKNLENDIKSVSCVISANENAPRENSIDAIIYPRKFPIVKPQDGSFREINHENNLNPKYTFENFIVGGSNELAHAACYAVSQNLGKAYNPLFIYGGVGLGKTHLLQSIGNEIIKKNPKYRVKYIPSERFANDLIESMRMQKINEFKEYYRKIDLLIIDDIQFLSGKEKTQVEFFHIFNYLYQLNRQIVLSSDRAPKAIPTLEERLRSRFEGGMIADVSKPDLETRVAILRKKIKDEGIQIEDKAIFFIAENITNNIRELEGALNRISVSAQLSNREITADYVASLLSELISSGKKKGITHNHILKVVCEFYDVSLEDLVQKNRKKEVSKPRQVAMYLMRSELKYSYPGIGEKLGGRDHTTALHAHEKISKELSYDERLLEDITALKEKIYSI
jgi:chromosomal replication initiator protein